ncbi:MAG: TonB-dependent receptor, partial [Steroidobacteraceae bacterium]
IAAWKGGADWHVLEGLRLRATRSRDVRAGSLAERLDVSGFGITIRDPFLAEAGQPIPAYAITATRGANPAIDPEKGDTTTFGFVYQTEGSRPFALSADYFDIRIGNAISTPGVQNIIDRCFNETALQLCPLITRNETGLIADVNNAVLNIALARSRGIDVETSWRSPVQLFGGAESIAFRALGNYAIESSTTIADSGTRLDRVRQTGQSGGAPRWQANLSLAYRRDTLQVSIQQQLISAGIYSAQFAVAGPSAIDDNTIGSVTYTNLRADWNPPAWPQLTLFGHVANVFDRAPPAGGDWGFAGSLPTNESLFDPIGRRVTLGVRYER